MESNTLIQELSAAIKRAADKYRKILETDGIKATGGMQEFTTEFELNDEKFVLYFNMPEYWKYVEYGRKPGKFPPIDKIRQWIKVKPVLPRPGKNGKLPTENQLAFLIARKIAKKGIPATHSLSKTVNNFNLRSQIMKELERQVIKEIKNKYN